MPHSLLNSDQATNHIHKAHHVGIHGKLCKGSACSIIPQPFSNTTTSIHLGPICSPGYFRSQFFCLPTSTRVPPAPIKGLPPQLHSLSRRFHHIQTHTCSSSAPHHLLSRTNKIWLANHSDDKFGPTCHATTPSQWATQLLATHLSGGYAQHLSTSITTILDRNQYHATRHTSTTLLSPRLPHIHISSYFRNSKLRA
jgi:hypothetical protein